MQPKHIQQIKQNFKGNQKPVFLVAFHVCNLFIAVLLIALPIAVKANSEQKETPTFTLERITTVTRFSIPSEGNYVCQQLRQPIDVDAKLDDWEGVEPIRLGGDSKDISVRAYLGWDLENLYFACDVTDDVLDQNQEMAKVEYVDHLRLDFDLRNDGATPRRKDDQRYIIALGTDNKAKWKGEAAVKGELALLYFRRFNVPKKLANKAKVAAVQKDDGTGYIVEANLPGEILQPFAPLAQASCGFRLTAVDFDSERAGEWLSTCASDNADDWGVLFFVPAIDLFKEYTGEIFVPRAPLERYKPLQAELTIVCPQPVPDARLQARLTGLEDSLESSITNLELSEGLNRFRLAWDTHSLKEGGYVIQITVSAQGRQLLSVSSRRLSKHTPPVAEGPITRPETLEAQLKQFDPYIEKYAVENVIQRIQEVPYNPEKGFRFVVFGDSKYKTTLFNSIVENINVEEPLFVIGVGDLVRSGGIREFRDFLKFLEEQTDYNFLPVIGNHDIGHQKKEFMYIFGKLNYSFDYGGCRFVILDNAAGKLTEKQLSWADDKLKEARSLRKLVFLHMPPKTIGKWAWHSFGKGSNKFVNLMKKRHVDEVFIGHIHAYSTEERDGVRYTVTGGAGASLHRRFGPKGNAHHYVVVDVNKDGIQQRVVRLVSQFVEGLAGNPYYAGAAPDTKIPESIAVVKRGDAGWKYTKVERAAVPIPSESYWFADEYDATAWSEGKAPFGYEEKGIKTELDEGEDYYFLKHFDIQNTDQFSSVIVRVASDDAASVYLNGALIDKDPAWNANGHEFAYWNRQIVLKPDTIRKGINVIAVMLKNGVSSSDAYLDIEVLVVHAGGTK